MIHTALQLTVLVMAWSPPVQIDTFYWLNGTWSMTRPDGSQRLEIWDIQDETALSGKGLKVNGPDTLLMENLQLLYNDHSFWYIPTVPDQNHGQPIAFELTSQDGKVFVFENVLHDFPQRIVYHFKPQTSPDPSRIAFKGDTLDVRVEDLKGEGISFRFFRQ